MSMLRAASVDLVLDVGANIGQYAMRLREFGYRGRIVSFEPLSTAFKSLEQACASDAGWEAVPVALGGAPGKATLHVSSNSWSSSLLEMLPGLVEAAPESAFVGAEEVTVQTLAWALDKYRENTEATFLKLDVQGSERAIIEGAGDWLQRLAGIQIELSLAPLYQGESLYLEMIALLSAKGFVLMDLEPGYRDPGSGQLLQVDGIFFRPRVPVSPSPANG